MPTRSAFVLGAIYLGFVAGQSSQGEPPTARDAKSLKTDQPVRTDRYGDPLPPGVVARLGTERLALGNAVFLAFSPDGRRLAAHNGGESLRIWDVATGKELLRLTTPAFRGYGTGMTPLAFSPDSKAIALACSVEWVRGGNRQATVRVWEVATGKELHCFGGLQRQAIRLVFSPDGRYLFSGGYQAPLLRWDLTRGGAPKEYGNFHAVDFLAISRDSKTLTAVTYNQGDWSKRIFLRWDVATGKEIGRHTLTTAGSGTGALSPDGDVFAAPDVDGKSIALLDPLTGRKRIQAHESDSPALISISADGTTMTSSSWKGSIRVWDAATGKLRTRFKTPSTRVSCAALSPDGKWLALSGRADGAVHLWDVATGRELHSFVGHRGGPLTIAFLKDGKEIATVNREGRPIAGNITAWADWSFRRWDAATGAERAVTSPNPKGEVWHTSFSADGRLLASVIQDGTLRLWDVESGKELRSWMGPTRETTTTTFDGKGGKTVAKNPYPAITTPVFSTDGKTLLAGYGTKIHRWETATGRELAAFEIEEIPQHQFQHITWCLPSPDGLTLAVWSRGLILLDSASGTVKQRLKDIGRWERRPPAFSPDGRTIAVLETGAVSFWEVASGRPRGRLKTPRQASGLAFSPDGRLLVLGAGPESPLSLWELATGQVVGRLRDDRGGGEPIAFSPDGSRLVVAGSRHPGSSRLSVVDYCPVVLVCDVAELCGKKTIEEIAKIAALSAEELEELWAELSGTDDARAYRAIRRLGLAGPQGAAFLKARLKSDKLPVERRIARLIADLDDDTFAKREKASAELRKLGVRAAPALRRTQKGKVSAEVRSRAKRLLERLDTPQEPPSPELVRRRVVEALEANGSKEARQALAELSEGAADTVLTREAKASLERLSRQPAPAP
jgi:WD40 repeat protein